MIIIKQSLSGLSKLHCGKKELRHFIFFMLSLLLFPLSSSGQCDYGIFPADCSFSLGSYNYIRSYTVQARPRKKAVEENTYIFTKGSTYRMIACAGDGKMTISLYDKDHNLIATTFDQTEGKNFFELQYPCSSTGIYYIKTSLEGARAGCGLCVLGFSKE
ncbi:MAG TPA: hypothetical protein VHO46_06110 [Bacteroidales bacterium]|nr:hypothetical protein [Bacteroidales bacterium]